MTDTNTKKRTRVAYLPQTTVSDDEWLAHPRIVLGENVKKHLASAGPEELKRWLPPSKVRLVVFNLLNLRPDWSAVAASFHCVNLVGEGQVLGSIEHWYSRRSNEYGVEVDCERIRRASSSRRAKHAVDIATAVRCALDNFRPKTTKELWADTNRQIDSELYSVSARTERRIAEATRTLMDRAFAFAMGEAKGEFLNSLDDEGVAAFDERESMLPALADITAMKTVTGYIKARIVDDTVTTLVDGEPVSFPVDAVPEWLSNALALRLMPEAQAIPELGVRFEGGCMVVKPIGNPPCSI